MCVYVFTRLETSDKIGAELGEMSRKCREKAHSSLCCAGQVGHEHTLDSFSLSVHTDKALYVT